MTKFALPIVLAQGAYPRRDPNTSERYDRILRYVSGECCASGRLIYPLGFRCDMGLRMRTRTVEAGGAHGHQYPHLLVVVA
jgi:hypothetical protein